MTKQNVQVMEPELCAHPEAFCLVGYPIEAEAGLDTVQRGAYWQGKQFPPFDAAEYAKIGGGPAEIGVWTHEDGRMIYVFGYVVPALGYVPEGMQAVTIPGGDFAVFQVPACKGADELGEAVLATWRYACEEWLPGSAYEVDSSRSAFEYYLDSDSRIYIPVKEKA